MQWELPSDPSSLIRWRHRLGKDGLEKLLSETIVTAVKSGTLAPKDLERVIVDTTVMEKNIAYPTDTKLLNKACEQLVALVQDHGLKLRQTYARVGTRASRNAAHYRHAKQFKRMKKEIKKLKNYLGRVVRDIERQVNDRLPLQEYFTESLLLAKRLITQEKQSKDKLYSLHAPEAYCIAKGKVGKPYEFGCKVSLVVTHQQGLALSSQALHKNQFDGHTLSTSLQHAEAMAHVVIHQAFVDKGYKGHDVENKEVYISGQKRGITRRLKNF